MSAILKCHKCDQILDSAVLISCCQENVCKSCFKSLELFEDVDAKQFLHCPICQTKQPAENFSENMFMNSYIKEMSLKDCALNLSCSRCDEDLTLRDAVFCEVCQSKELCSNCYDEIHSKGGYKTHLKKKCLTPWDSSEHSPDHNICSIHNQELSMICLKKFSCLCNLCVIEHKKICKCQAVVPLVDANSELIKCIAQSSEKLFFKRKILTINQEMTDSDLSSIDEKYTAQLNSLQTSFGKIRELLELKEQQIIHELQQKRNHLIQQNEANIKKRRDFFRIIEDLINIINYASNTSAINLTKGFKFVMQKIEQADSKATTLDYHILLSNMMDFPILNLEEVFSSIDKIAVREFQAEKSISTSKQVVSSRSAKKKEDHSVTPKSKGSTLMMNSQDLKLAKEQGKPQSLCDLQIPSAVAPKSYRSYSRIDETSIPSFDLNFAPKGVVTPQPNKLVLNPLQEISGNTCTEFKTKRSNSKSYIKSIEAGAAKGSYDLNRGDQSSHLHAGTRTKFSCTPTKQQQTPKEKAQKLCLTPVTPDRRQNNFDFTHINEINKNPLKPRNFTKSSATSTCIMVSWTHSNQQLDLYYKVEFGIGAKVSGKEQFREAYRGSSNSCIISDLRPKTTYRIRVCAFQIKKKETINSSPGKKNLKDREEVFGEWSEVLAILTLEPQNMDESSLGSHARVLQRGEENIIQFDRAGIIYAAHGYSFGKAFWTVRIHLQSAHLSADDSTSFLKVGVTNKVGKTLAVVGAPINYGLNHTSMLITFSLDLDARTLTIFTQGSSAAETFFNLPEGALYPAFQNKTSKNGSSSLKIGVSFDKTTLE